MFILDSPLHDPAFNIAAEEYLLKETGGEFAFFYTNEPSIIIGKHQNAWAEINIPWIRDNNIPVIRRISGGGTVWHDLGNLNFSFILNGEEGKLVNFREYAKPVLDFLVEMGVPAEFGDRNQILAGGLKISGNAESVHRGRVLHHGTLLYSSNLVRLGEALDAKPDEYIDRAVQSIRSRTVNIRDFLDDPPDIKQFRDKLIGHIERAFPGSKRYRFYAVDRKRIEALVQEKYSTWNWNFGYSPRYRLKRVWMIGGIWLQSELSVEKGRITACSIECLDEASPASILTANADGLEELSRQLVGNTHDPSRILEFIASRRLVKPRWIDKFVEGLF
jgi:lipoate-protein ligase A